MLRLIPKSRLGQDMAAFLTDRLAGGCSGNTVNLYRQELTFFRDWLADQGVSDTLSVTADHIRRYLVCLAARRNKGGVHAAYRNIGTFFRWVEHEYEPQDWHNPILKLKPPKLAANPLPPVSVDTLKAMLATCDKSFTGQRDKAIIMALLDTGCRASEFVALDVGDVDASTGAVVVRRGKGDKRRVVFLGAKTRRELLRYLRGRGNPDAGALWVTDEGGQLTYSGLRQIVRRRAIRAGVKEPPLHSFRRAFALACLRNGVDLISLQRLMGHADLSVLRRYLAQVESDLREAHAKGGPVDRLL
jgi:integrase/recombinase XerD